MTVQTANRTLTRRVVIAAVGAAAALGLGACSLNFGASGVDKDEVASSIQTEFRGQGHTIDEVRCPENLPAEQGATIECALLRDSQWYPVTVSAGSVDGDQVNMNFQVRDTTISEPDY